MPGSPQAERAPTSLGALDIVQGAGVGHFGEEAQQGSRSLDMSLGTRRTSRREFGSAGEMS